MTQFEKKVDRNLQLPGITDSNNLYMKKNKMTPWILDEDGFIYSQGNQIADFDINGDDIDDREKRKAMAVAAVNNTYGAGINPEVVPDLLDALKKANDYLRATAIGPVYHQFGTEAIKKAILTETT